MSDLTWPLSTKVLRSIRKYWPGRTDLEIQMAVPGAPRCEGCGGDLDYPYDIKCRRCCEVFYIGEVDSHSIARLVT